MEVVEELGQVEGGECGATGRQCGTVETVERDTAGPACRTGLVQYFNSVKLHVFFFPQILIYLGLNLTPSQFFEEKINLEQRSGSK